MPNDAGAASSNRNADNERLVEECCGILDVLREALDRARGNPALTQRLNTAITSVAHVLDETG